MEKFWYIRIAGYEEGPFTANELRRDPRITPDTLVWRKGFSAWVPIRLVPELKYLFKDEGPQGADQEQEAGEAEGKSVRPPREAIALDLRSEPPQIFFWVIFALVVLAFILVYYLRNA